MPDVRDLEDKVDRLLRRALEQRAPDHRAQLISEAAYWQRLLLLRAAGEQAVSGVDHLRIVPDLGQQFTDSPDARIGRAIARGRGRKAMSQAEMARLLGVHDIEAAALEAGDTRISAVQLGRIALVLGVAATDILRDAETGD